MYLRFFVFFSVHLALVKAGARICCAHSMISQPFLSGMCSDAAQVPNLSSAFRIVLVKMWCLHGYEMLPCISLSLSGLAPCRASVALSFLTITAFVCKKVMLVDPAQHSRLLESRVCVLALGQ